MSTSVGSSTSSTSSTSSSSSSRLTGMYSNMDTDALVKSLVSTQQTKIDHVKQRETKQEWYETALSDVEDDVNTFISTYTSATNSTSLLKASAYVTNTVTSDSTSNAATVTAGNTADVGTYTVKIDQLAVNANTTSSGSVSSAGNTSIASSNTAALSSLTLANPLQFDVNGKISFSINGKKFEFSKTTTLQTMLNTINSDSDAKVTMKYSRLTDKFTITADDGGATSSVNIENLSGNAFGTNSAFKISTGTVKNGQDSIAEINGTTVNQDSNTYTIDGVTYTLNSVTKGTSDETINYTVARDYTSTTKSISDFVTGFNTLIKKLQDLDSEKDYSADYPPLTDAQKESMTADQVTAWETKAKSGLLRHNTELEGLISTLKSAFFTTAGGTGKNATSVGITTAGYFDSNSGQLVLDTDTLKSALQENPELLVTMFTNGSTSSAAADQGIMYKLKTAAANFKDSTDTVVKNVTTTVKNLATNVTDLEDKLDQMSQRYYSKFSAMEEALAKLNSQSSYISKLFTSSSS